MSLDRRHQLSSLYHAALARPAGERPAFLEAACDGDETLLREVESLLAQEHVDSLNQPALTLTVGPAHGRPLAGRQFGNYFVKSLIGAGGMGEVFLARDNRLGRDVAIKILPSAFSSSPERIARFEREARLLASLNHPRIGAIYGVEEAEGVRALVLELIEGSTLAERLAEGRLPVAEALPIARQIAEALEAAHDKGIIHRDLKPANIKIASDGQVKVLDFGIAKVMESGSIDEASRAPTKTSTGTAAGIVVGTPAYMSPEQIRGEAVDRRADIWAFGCVLFEMLAGRRAFNANTSADTVASVLERSPDRGLLPDVPAPVRRLLRRCLEKDRRQRLADIADARLEIDEALAPSSRDETGGARRPPAYVALIMTVAAGALVVAAAAGLYCFQPAATPPEAIRLSVTLPANTRFQVAGGSTGAPAGNSGSISPDGRKLLFTLVDNTGNWQMWIRSLVAPSAYAVQGTEGANSPFWSPDSRRVGFFAAGKLKTIDITSGSASPITICDAPNGRGGAWNDDDVIVFAPSNTTPLYRVSARGGQPVQVTTLQPGDSWHRSPSFLPDGQHFLYRALGTSPGILIGSLNSAPATRLTAADTNAVYAPPGYVLFTRATTLLAQPFDASTRQLTGEPQRIAEDVATDLVNGLSAFSVSANDVLAFRRGGIRAGAFQLAWFDRGGTQLGSVGPPAPYRGVSLSPDGKQVAMHRHDGQGGDVWLFDLARGAMPRFTFEPAQDNASPVWSPDGQRVAYASMRDGKWGIYQKAANSSGAEELLVQADSVLVPTSWAPDGRSLLYEVVGTQNRNDLMLLSLTSPRSTSALLQTPFNESLGQVSRDGKWFTYQSNESGQSEVYVDAFPAGGAKLQISTDGGTAPRWRADGREILYTRSSTEGWKMMAAALAPDGSGMRAEPPRALFDFDGLNVNHATPYYAFDLTADGQRILLGIPNAEEVATVIDLVLNWPAALVN
jgi:eukaryotic-like serine/threonine-protein kinase